MEIDALEELGLSRGEALVYLSILRLGETKVGAVIEKSGLASSVVHTNINKLAEKGLVSYVKKGKIKFYKAIAPKYLLNLLEDKRKRFIQILPELELTQKSAGEKEEAEVFEGINGVTAMLNILIGDARKGEEYLFFSANMPGQNKEIQEFWEKYDAKRKEKGLNVMGLATKELKPLYVHRKVLNMRYTSLPITSSITIFRNKVVMFSFSERPVGYLITSNQISKMFREFFHNVWKQAS